MYRVKNDEEFAKIYNDVSSEQAHRRYGLALEELIGNLTQALETLRGVEKGMLSFSFEDEKMTVEKMSRQTEDYGLGQRLHVKYKVSLGDDIKGLFDLREKTLIFDSASDDEFLLFTHSVKTAFRTVFPVDF